MHTTLIIMGIATALSTFIGGRLALGFRDRLHLILGISAGAVIGVSLFDLLPEAITTGLKFYTVDVVTLFVAIGFVTYMLIDRIFKKAHTHDHEPDGEDGAVDSAHEESAHRGHIGAGSLTLHSLLDGIGIGLAFQVSAAVGYVVFAAVIAHDFSDGINTVNMSLFGGGKRWHASRWLIADALAPIVGIISTFFFQVPEHYFALILALFSGFFLYIGASELLPESHHRHPRVWTSCATVIGMAIIFIAIHFASF